ncbi:MAG: glycosyltransferase family 4 protein [Bacteroidales bacterium]|nr:glycosyltransferase family 4 protein [Bacteroidales bacterium]
MKILFVLEYYYPNIGGVETLFKTLAESLVQKGHEVSVITMRFKNDLPVREKINGVEIIRTGLSNRYLFTLFGLFPVLKKAGNFDLIQTTSYGAAFPAVIAGKLKKKKTVITFHELWGNLWFKLPFLSLPEKIINYLTEQIVARLPYHKIITVSDFTKNSFLKANIGKNRIERIYNGLDYTAFGNFQYNPPKNFTFTYFGRLGVSKGIDLLLDAAKRFLPENPESILKLIIPTRPEKMYRRITDIIKKSGISKQVQIKSNLDRDTLFRELCYSSCIVIPSYSEGFGFTAAESAGLGVPVISSKQGALQEVVSGRLITMEKFNSQSLYKALVDAKQGKWQQTERKRFPLETSVEAYEKLYASIAVK